VFRILDLSREDKGNLITLLAIGVLLRLYAFSQIYMITLDGAFQYIPVAKLFYEGEYLQALSQPQLPLYPFLISLLSHITGSFELSGQLISILFSLAAVFPLYLIGKSLFGPKPAFWSTVLYLINPLMLYSSVDVLKEGLLIFLLLSSVYCSLRFLQEGKGQWLIWTIIPAIIGALVRMNTLVVLAVMGMWSGYGLLRRVWREKKALRRYLWAAVVSLGIVLILVITGIWGWEFLAGKKPYMKISQFFSQWFLIYAWPSLSHVGEGIVTIIGRFVEKAYLVPFPLALLGLGWRIKAKEFGAEEKYLALLMGILVVIFFPNLYASGRYLLPAIFLLYLWAGFGLIKGWELIQRRFATYPRLTTVIPVVIILGAMVPLCLQPQRLDKIGRKEVGLWLQEQSLSSPAIITNIPRIAYYAGGEYLLFPHKAIPKRIVSKGRKEKADYLVLEEEDSKISKAFVPFEQKGELDLILRHPYSKEGDVIYVYKLRGKGE
jgi:hypothetical protein